MKRKPILTPEEQERIRKAVEEAERKTSGEIVPYIVEQSDRYEVAHWRGATLGILIGMLIAAGVYLFYQGWGLEWLHQEWGLLTFLLVLGILGMTLAYLVPPVRRFLAGEDNLIEQVHKRAMMAFVEEEVFNTRDRTGILIFVSLFERRIEVIGDAGINQRVKSEEWVDIVLHIREGIRKGRLAEALVEAIHEAGALLERSQVTIRPDDTDELANKVRLRKR